MAAGSSSESNNKTYGTYMYKVQINLIGNHEEFVGALWTLCPSGPRLQYASRHIPLDEQTSGSVTVTLVTDTELDKDFELQTYLQGSGVLLIEPRSG